MPESEHDIIKRRLRKAISLAGKFKEKNLFESEVNRELAKRNERLKKELTESNEQIHAIKIATTRLGDKLIKLFSDIENITLSENENLETTLENLATHSKACRSNLDKVYLSLGMSPLPLLSSPSESMLMSPRRSRKNSMFIKLPELSGTSLLRKSTEIVDNAIASRVRSSLSSFKADSNSADPVSSSQNDGNLTISASLSVSKDFDSHKEPSLPVEALLEGLHHFEGFAPLFEHFLVVGASPEAATEFAQHMWTMEEDTLSNRLKRTLGGILGSPRFMTSEPTNAYAHNGASPVPLSRQLTNSIRGNAPFSRTASNSSAGTVNDANQSQKAPTLDFPNSTNRESFSSTTSAQPGPNTTGNSTPNRAPTGSTKSMFGFQSIFTRSSTTAPTAQVAIAEESGNETEENEVERNTTELNQKTSEERPKESVPLTTSEIPHDVDPVPSSQRQMSTGSISSSTSTFSRWGGAMMSFSRLGTGVQGGDRDSLSSSRHGKPPAPRPNTNTVTVGGTDSTEGLRSSTSAKIRNSGSLEDPSAKNRRSFTLGSTGRGTPSPTAVELAASPPLPPAPSSILGTTSTPAKDVTNHVDNTAAAQQGELNGLSKIGLSRQSSDSSTMGKPSRGSEDGSPTKPQTVPSTLQAEDFKMGRAITSPTLLYRYPPGIEPPPQEVCDFCLPLGGRIRRLARRDEDTAVQEILFGHSNSKRSSRCFLFFLEDKTSTDQCDEEVGLGSGRLYGICVLHPRLLKTPIASSRRGHQGGEGEHYHQYNDPEFIEFESMVCYAFITRFPLFDFFFQLIFDMITTERLVRMEMAVDQSDSDLKYSRNIYQYLPRAILEDILGRLTKVKPPLYNERIFFTMNAGIQAVERFRGSPQKDWPEHLLNAAEWALPTLMSWMPVETLVWALSLLLVEAKLIVVGNEPGMISCAVMGLLVLLKPLDWVAPMIPMLPLKLLDFIESPVPLLAGFTLDENDKSLDVTNILERSSASEDDIMVAVLDVRRRELLLPSSFLLDVRKVCPLPDADVLANRLRACLTLSPPPAPVTPPPQSTFEYFSSNFTEAAGGGGSSSQQSSSALMGAISGGKNTHPSVVRSRPLYSVSTQQQSDARKAHEIVTAHISAVVVMAVNMQEKIDRRKQMIEEHARRLVFSESFSDHGQEEEEEDDVENDGNDVDVDVNTDTSITSLIPEETPDFTPSEGVEQDSQGVLRTDPNKDIERLRHRNETFSFSENLDELQDEGGTSSAVKRDQMQKLENYQIDPQNIEQKTMNNEEFEALKATPSTESNVSMTSAALLSYYSKVVNPNALPPPSTSTRSYTDTSTNRAKNELMSEIEQENVQVEQSTSSDNLLAGIVQLSCLPLSEGNQDCFLKRFIGTQIFAEYVDAKGLGLNQPTPKNTTEETKFEKTEEEENETVEVGISKIIPDTINNKNIPQLEDIKVQGNKGEEKIIVTGLFDTEEVPNLHAGSISTIESANISTSDSNNNTISDSDIGSNLYSGDTISFSNINSNE